MKIKQVIAGGLAAVAALATIGFSALGAVTLDQGLEPFVTVTDTTLTSPAIVIGSSAGDPVGYPKDVAGAGDIAASMVSNYATVEKTTPGVTTTSVSGGALVSTESTKLYGGDHIGKTGLRTTLTSANLPTMLASGTFSDDSGTTYKYNQYINLNPTTTATIGLVSYGNSGGDLEDPAAYLATGSSTSTPLFNMTVVFNRMLNISHADVQGNTITLFGKTYTIGSNSDFTAATKKLELFGGAEAKTIKEGEKVTVTVEGTDYEVEVIGVSTSTIAAISVDGVSKEVTQGNSYTISGLDVYVDTVFYLPKETQVSSVKMSFGTAKLILQDGQTVKVGQNEDTIDGTLVSLVGSANTGISKISLGVTAKDSSVDHISANPGAFTDPVFEAVKLAYGGATGGTTDLITIDNSGTTAATLKFTDYWGNEKTITWAYTGSSSFAPQLNWSATRRYHVVEGETVRRNEYIVLAPQQQSDFGHIFQYTTASSIGSSGAYIELKDVVSGDTNRIYLTDTGYASATFYVDGQPYYVKNVSSSAQTFNFTWGTGASAGVGGNALTLYPLVKAKGGEWIALTTNVTIANNTVYELPTNSSFNITTAWSTWVANPFQMGRVWYRVTNDNDFRLANTTAGPAILVLEENAKDTSTPEVDVKDAIVTTIADGSGSGVDVTIQTPALTESVALAGGWTTWTSDNSVSSIVDRRGTYVKYDSDSQGLAEITYTDEQATAAVAVGSDPVFTTTTTAGGTYKEAVPVTNPVVKLDGEVDTTALTQDLILVGGPCANTLVKTLLDTAWNVSDSCSGWDLTSGNGLIKVVEDAFGSGQKALIVAGTDADDTRNLIGNYVIKPTKMATLTGAEYKGAVA